MKQIICITCPIGCRIMAGVVGGKDIFFGNKCPKGIHFAKTELTSPVRSLTTTVRTAFPGIPVLPVKIDGEIPKGKTTEIIYELSKIVITERIGIGETVAVNISGTRRNVIAASNMLKEEGP